MISGNVVFGSEEVQAVVEKLFRCVQTIATVCVVVSAICNYRCIHAGEFEGGLFRGAVENAKVARSIDVLVWHFEALMHHGNESNEEKFTRETTTQHRLVLDRDAERGVDVKSQKRIETFGKKVIRDSQLTELLTYRDGMLRRLSSLSVPAGGGVGQKLPFEEFLRFAPAVTLAQLNVFGGSVNQRETDLEKRVAGYRDNASSQLLPDGTTVVTFRSSKEDTERISTVRFDKKSSMPTEFTSRGKVDGEDLVVFHQKIAYESFNGIFLATSISYEQTYEYRFPGTTEPKLADVIGTMELQWNSVNPEVLSFPDDKTLFSKWPKSGRDLLEEKKQDP
jgi:hypothetical protein